MDAFWIAIISAITGAIAGGIASYLMDKRKYKKTQTNLLRDRLVLKADRLSQRKFYEYIMGDEDFGDIPFYIPSKVDEAEAEINQLKAEIEDAVPDSPEDDPYYANLMKEVLNELDDALQRIEIIRKSGMLFDPGDL